MAALAPQKTGWLARRFTTLSTGMKVFGLITFALLPLGIVALLASLASNREADVQRRYDLRVAVTENARQIAGALSADLATLQDAADGASDPATACARLDTALRARVTNPPMVAVYGPARERICARAGVAIAVPAPSLIADDPHVLFRDDAMVMIVPQHNGTGVAVALYPIKALSALIKPDTGPLRAKVVIADGANEVTLSSPPNMSFGLAETYAAPLGVFALTLRMSIPPAPMTALEWFDAFLPLLMWASAALIGFFVIDRLIISPLAQLRRNVASFTPGSGPDNGAVMPPIRTPVREIVELAETFETVRTTIARHEANLASALDDQVRLTREVHHRVKNNLQVVASLISLHARSATPGPVADAYASIQRRVDALSIVHRNHYAEIEGSGGISAKALLGEIAANLRTGIAAMGTAPPIAVQSAQVRLSQDVAVPVAFLITELVELSVGQDPHAAIAIKLIPDPTDYIAKMTVASRALDDIGKTGALADARHGRIVEALARQLRSPLVHDAEAGGYAFSVPCLPADPCDLHY